MMSAVGDTVQVLPVVNALKRRFPYTHITWVIQPGPHELVAHHPAVDEFVLFRRGSRSRRPRSLLEGIRTLAQTAGQLRKAAEAHAGSSFDLLLDLQVYFKAGILTALTPARVKLGFDFHRTRDLNWLFTKRRLPPRPDRYGHTQDQYLEFLQHLGVDPKPVRYGLAPTREEQEAQARFFRKLNAPACGLILASSNPKKDWHPVGYAQLAQELVKRFGLLPILLGGRSQGEDLMALEVQRRTRVPMVDARAPGLRRLLWLLEGCSLVISPDTGPLHMARALEVPVVGLYGYTNPKRSGPYRMFEDLVVDGYARDPGEDYPLTMDRRPGGMDRITPDMVLEKVERAMELYVR